MQNSLYYPVKEHLYCPVKECLLFLFSLQSRGLLFLTFLKSEASTCFSPVLRCFSYLSWSFFRMTSARSFLHSSVPPTRVQGLKYVQLAYIFSNLVLFHQGQVYNAPGFPSVPGFSEVSLAGRSWDKGSI